jgi:glycosyltransferase involved in cell wall biosynthesis
VIPEILETLDRTPAGTRSLAAIPGNLQTIPLAARRLRELAARVGATLIYSHGSWPNHLAAEATRGTTTGAVWHIHSPYALANDFAARVAARRGRVAGVIAVSKSAGEPYRRFAAMTVVLNGVDLDACAAASRSPVLREQVGIPLDAFVFGYAGRLVPHKGTAEAADAAAAVLARVPDAHVVVLGANPASGSADTLAAMKATLAARGVGARAHFPGYVREPLPFIAGFDVALVPSTYADPCPLAAIEALALGVPVVGSRAGGIPELVDDGVTGLLVRPGDPDDLARAMGELAANRVRAKEMGERAREDAQTRFDRRRVVAAVADVLRQSAR